MVVLSMDCLLLVPGAIPRHAKMKSGELFFILCDVTEL